MPSASARTARSVKRRSRLRLWIANRRSWNSPVIANSLFLPQRLHQHPQAETHILDQMFHSYSYRSATMGSTLAARPGARHEANPAETTHTTTALYVHGSRTEMPHT